MVFDELLGANFMKTKLYNLQNLYEPKANFTFEQPYKPNISSNKNIKNKLFSSDKIEVRESTLEGYGVFAKEDIKSGEVLEECHYVEVGSDGDVDRYKFNWPRGTENPEKVVLPLGFGSIYNTVINEDEKTVDWKTNLELDIFVFYTIKDIKKDDEILTYYDYGDKI